MLDRNELEINDEFVGLFEKWVCDMHPDDGWRLNRIDTDDGWEYEHEHTEDDFIMWINIKVYSQTHNNEWYDSEIIYK